MDNTYIKQLIENNPVLYSMSRAEPALWINTSCEKTDAALENSGFSRAESQDAEARLLRFATLIQKLFPETAGTGGLIESPLLAVPKLATHIRQKWQVPLNGKLLIKLDSHLPVSGSIKARGGFYEVLCLAEKLAIKNGLITQQDDYSILADEKCKNFFSRYSIAVGSTGNLGLSVGLMGSALGFRVTIHMSADARQWKKDMLRAHGAEVIEYAASYSSAVAAGRAAAEKDPYCHFVDDESSRELFLGYSVAGLRLKKQLGEMGISIGKERPLVVYLPCGVGGSPGGVCFGLKQSFGDDVYCYFAEPVQAPAVSLGLASGLDDAISAGDIGLSGRTAADGLAVTRPSGPVCKAMRHLLAGAFTVPDDFLFTALHNLYDTEGLRLEPSALAGFYGLRHCAEGKLGAEQASEKAVHLLWATGGSLVPAQEWQEYYNKGQS